jgi:transcriptional regulator with XRE-family HTH domain
MRATPDRAGGRSISAGALLRRLRSQRRVSQLELSLRAGVSQRHLSCVETGRAGASRGMLLALLDALEAPLPERNDVLLAAGFAPAYGQRSLDEPDMAPVRQALSHLLAVHDPAPAIVLDGAWNLVQANRGAGTLLRLLRADPAAFRPGTNLLRATLSPGGLKEEIVNRDEVCAEMWRRAVNEAAHMPALRSVIEELRPFAPRPSASSSDVPMLLARFRTAGGELSFFSTFTTFGAPLDVTIASLRVEHMFPADEATRQALVRDR